MRKQKKGHKNSRHYYSEDRHLRVSNRWEIQLVEELLAQGFHVFHRGWPDYVAVQGDVVRFIEVKPPRGYLSIHQRAMARILARFGITVEIYNGKELKEITETGKGRDRGEGQSSL